MGAFLFGDYADHDHLFCTRTPGHPESHITVGIEVTTVSEPAPSVLSWELRTLFLSFSPIYHFTGLCCHLTSPWC